jgi:tRNA/tmRNA/rRNA uracil-C5-methylase (TrmA/RlmC/RlmD family)
VKEQKPRSVTLLDVQVTDVASGGAGIAREAGGRVLFIPLSAPGDRARVRIVGEERRYAQAELVELLEPAPIRQQPPCPVFGRCGGCLWQHLPYSLQWKTKSRGLLHTLERRQIQAPSVVDELPAEQIWGYRNRIQLRGEGEKLGFFARGGHQLVPIESCPIARRELNETLGETRAEGALLGRPYKVELEVLEDGRVRRTWNAPHAAGGFRQVHDAQNEKLRDWIMHRVPTGRAVLDLFGGQGNLSLGLARRETASEVHCVDLSCPDERLADAPPSFYCHRSAVLPWLLRRFPKTGANPLENSAILDPPREGLDEDF